MQTLWARIAQSPAVCKCANCTVKSSLVRHAGSASAKTSSRYFTSSTLLYSSIFALAATTDAVVKERRNQKWDAAIAEAKQGIERLDQTENQHDAEKALVRDLQALDDTDFISSPTAWPENTGAEFDQANFPPQSLHASRWFRDSRSGGRWSAKKLQVTSLAVDRLTLQTLLRIGSNGGLADESLEEYSDAFEQLVTSPRSVLKALLVEVKQRTIATRRISSSDNAASFQWQSAGMTHYCHDDTGAYLELAADLDRRVESIIQTYRKGAMSSNSLMLSLLHQLTSSSAPPQVQTWNRLITELSQSRTNARFVDGIIRTMERCNTRADEGTLISVLSHYRREKDYLQFRHWVELIQGRRRGLMLARSDIRHLEPSHNRIVSVERNGTRKLVQKPVATPQLFGTLVEGVLEFEGFEAALDVCRSMGLEGWGLSMRGLTPILDHCARRGDWTSGKVVWDQIQRVRDRAIRTRRSASIHPRIWASALLACRYADQKEDFAKLLQQAARLDVGMRRIRYIAERLDRKWRPVSDDRPGQRPHAADEPDDFGHELIALAVNPNECAMKSPQALSVDQHVLLQEGATSVSVATQVPNGTAVESVLGPQSCASADDLVLKEEPEIVDSSPRTRTGAEQSSSGADLARTTKLSHRGQPLRQARSPARQPSFVERARLFTTPEVYELAEQPVVGRLEAAA